VTGEGGKKARFIVIAEMGPGGSGGQGGPRDER